MHYVCVENKQVTSILNYKPGVPNTVTVVEISDEQYQLLIDGNHFFDTDIMGISPLEGQIIQQNKLIDDNAARMEYLKSTDWMILRHIREKALGLETSLSEDKYLQLEKKRQDTADSIVKQDQ